MKEAAPEMTLPPFLSLGRAAISAKAQQEDFAALTRIELSSEHVLEPLVAEPNRSLKPDTQPELLSSATPAVALSGWRRDLWTAGLQVLFEVALSSPFAEQSFTLPFLSAWQLFALWSSHRL